MSVSPYEVLITPLGAAASATMSLGAKLYDELTAAGIEVLLDDRDERPGVKFKDADLVGIPLRVSIGEKSLAKSEVELKPRGGTLQAVKQDEAVARVVAFRESRAVRLGMAGRAEFVLII
jgi:prolyl-tRNA synthetase